MSGSRRSDATLLAPRTVRETNYVWQDTPPLLLLFTQNTESGSRARHPSFLCLVFLASGGARRRLAARTNETMRNGDENKQPSPHEGISF